MNNLPQASISHSAATGRFIAIAFALAVTMAGATLASPLYPLYEHAFGITSGGVTIVYSRYMGGALVALLLLGHLSDHVGFVHALSIAVALLLAGLIISAAAHSLPVLAIGRFAIGIAAGIASSAATAGLVALEPAWEVKRAALVGSIMNIVGLGLGPFAGGVVAQILPHPLLTPSAVFGVSALLALVALAIHPADAEVHPIRHFRPALRFHAPTLAAVRPFAIASITTFTGYTLFSLFASLAPAFLGDLLPWHGPAVAGSGSGDPVCRFRHCPVHPAQSRRSSWPDFWRVVDRCQRCPHGCLTPASLRHPVCCQRPDRWLPDKVLPSMSPGGGRY